MYMHVHVHLNMSCIQVPDSIHSYFQTPIHPYYKPGGSESMAEFLHKTLALSVLLNEGEQKPAREGGKLGNEIYTCS